MSQYHQLFLLFCLFCLRIEKKIILSCSRELQAKQKFHTLFVLLCNGIRYRSTCTIKDKKNQWNCIYLNVLAHFYCICYSAHPIFNRSPFLFVCLKKRFSLLLLLFLRHLYIHMNFARSRFNQSSALLCRFYFLCFFLLPLISYFVVVAWDWNSIMIPVARCSLPFTKFSF